MYRFTRRDFLSSAALSAAAGALPAAGESQTSQPGTAAKLSGGGKRQPNVLMIMSDQHMTGAMGVTGNTVVKTPHLDAFAQTGVLFESAYCCDPVCTPSRASMLTGLHVHNHHTPSNRTPWPFKFKTIAHHLNHAGYMTSLIGKMHFVDGQTHGFDYCLQFNDWHQALGPKTRVVAEENLLPNSGAGLPQIDDLWRDYGDPWTGYITRDDREGSILVGRPSELNEEDHFESFITRESIRFLKEHGKEQPFFLCSSFLKPHDPLTPAQRFASMYRSNDMRLPDSWGKVDLATVPEYVRASIKIGNGGTPELIHEEAGQRRMAAYYANVSQMDDCVGKLLQGLKDADLERDTIVLYTSDHGEMLGNHGLWQKNFFYEESVGVPLIFRVPGMTPQGVRCASPVSQVQLVPTLLDLCGVADPGGLDGKSLTQCLKAPAKFVAQDILSEREMFTPHAGYMLRSGEFKYCYSPKFIEELYDLRSDPKEMKNLAALPEFAAKRDEMKRRLATMAPLA